MGGWVGGWIDGWMDVQGHTQSHIACMCPVSSCPCVQGIYK